jgi:4-hydroxyphenylpyruvate dioxygenase
MATRMIPCISQVTTLPAAFDADLRAYSSVRCDATEVWLTKLETYLADRSLDDLERAIAEYGVLLAAAAGQGGLLLAQGDARREAFSLFERRLDLCRSLSIPTIIVSADFTGSITGTDYERAVVSLKQAGRLAHPRGVRLALEFQSRAPFCNNLCTAAALVEQCDEPNVGICFDVFHYHTGPSKFEDLLNLPPERLFHVQMSDLAGTPRELATDADRILPGDGDQLLDPIVAHLRAIGYAGCVSVELMNPQVWQLDPAQVAEVTMAALRRLLGLAR